MRSKSSLVSSMLSLVAIMASSNCFWVPNIGMVHSFPLFVPTSIISRKNSPVVQSLSSRIVMIVMPMSTSDTGSSDDEASSKRTRRRRKDIVSDNVGIVPSTDVPSTENVVQLKILDVRDVVSGKGEPITTETPSRIMENEYENDILADDEEWEYYYDDDDDDDGKTLSGLEQLLVDAKSMRTDKIEQTGEDFKVESPTSLKNILSTIVTADFFFVCALLVWFLVGIFCSSILKDDTIQIAFNSNFQMIAQPALGLLMVGSAASAFFKEETEDDVNYDTS